VSPACPWDHLGTDRPITFVGSENVPSGSNALGTVALVTIVSVISMVGAISAAARDHSTLSPPDPLAFWRTLKKILMAIPPTASPQ